VFYCKFHAKFKDKRILKIGINLAKLRTKNIVGLFLTHRVLSSLTTPYTPYSTVMFIVICHLFVILFVSV